MSKKRVVVLLSGGLDLTTVLAIEKIKGFGCDSCQLRAKEFAEAGYAGLLLDRLKIVV